MSYFCDAQEITKLKIIGSWRTIKGKHHICLPYFSLPGAITLDGFFSCSSTAVLTLFSFKKGQHPIWTQFKVNMYWWKCMKVTCACVHTSFQSWMAPSSAYTDTAQTDSSILWYVQYWWCFVTFQILKLLHKAFKACSLHECFHNCKLPFASEFTYAAKQLLKKWQFRVFWLLQHHFAVLH